MHEGECERCGQHFEKKWKSRFCSRQCWLKVHNNPERNGAVARATVEARADRLRGTGTKKSYIKRGGRHEHRVVAEEVLGRALRPGEVVHHLDENRRNNEPGNLIVLATQRDHAKLHQWMKRSGL